MEDRCRQECMRLFDRLAPLLPGTKSARNWIQKKIQSKSVDWILQTFERTSERLPNIDRPTEVFPFLLGLNTLVDCYSWFFAEEFVEPDVLLLIGTSGRGRSKLIKELRFYVANSALFEVQLDDSSILMSSSTGVAATGAGGASGTQLTLIERQRLRINKLRIKVFRFILLLLEKLSFTSSSSTTTAMIGGLSGESGSTSQSSIGDDQFRAIFEGFFDESFFQLLFQSILYPLRWKVNIDQSTIKKHHLPVLIQLSKRLIGGGLLNSDEINRMQFVLRNLLAGEFNLMQLVDFNDYSLFHLFALFLSFSPFSDPV